MKQLLITIVAVVLLGCGESQQSTPAPESKPVEPVAGAKAPAISIYNAAGSGDIEAIKQHLAAGTDVNAKGVAGWTALQHAAWYYHIEIVELLIGKGADVNVKADNGWTPLHNAISNEIVELLIAEGADVNAMNGMGVTPLDWAINLKQTEPIDLLRQHGGKTGEELKAEGK